MNKKIAIFQWTQLLALTAVKFLVDMFAGMLPAILPAVRAEFTLSLTSGVNILFALYLVCNGVQILVGHMRPDKTRPLFLYLGLILVAAVCLLDVVPRAADSVPLILLVVVSGFGIAIVHPESLRAVHALERISSSIGTAVFCAGGAVGFASGGLVSAALVSRFGLRGLYPLIFCPVVIVLIIAFLKIRLAVESKPGDANAEGTPNNRPGFWPIMVMAVPLAVSTIFIVSLLPTRLNELGFELTFGGFCVMIFCLGAVLGSFFWAAVAGKKGELLYSIIALFLGVPFLLVYLTLIEVRTAVWMLFGVGFCSAAAYPLMVSMARSATGPNLGRRMAFILGGVWGMACIVLRLSVPFAEHFGLHFVFRFVPAGYLVSGIVGILIMLKIARRANGKLSTTANNR